jgi:GAF domain-containing protein
MGFTYGQEKVTSPEETPRTLQANALRVPLMVSGTTIGIIEDAGSETDWTAKEIEIVSAVAGQLAKHLENLRLLEQNEKRTR